MMAGARDHVARATATYLEVDGSCELSAATMSCSCR